MKSALIFAAVFTVLHQAILVVTTKPRIGIAALTFKVPDPRQISMLWNLNSLQQTGAMMDLGMEYLVEHFGQVFNFSHTFLYDPGRPSGVLLTDDAERFVGQFYYQHNQTADGLALISACAREQVPASRLTREFHMLTMCSVGNGLTLQEYPQRISTSVYPASAMLSFIILLAQQNNWTDFTALIDLASYDQEALCRGMNDILTSRFANDTAYRYTKFPFNASAGRQEIEATLRKIGEVSRIIFIFASGMSDHLVMETADAMNMTNGEYVFFMFALDRYDDMGLGEAVSWVWTKANAHWHIPSQIFPSKSAIFLTFAATVSEEGIRKLRPQVLEIGQRKYNFSIPNDKLSMMLYASYEELLIYGIVLNETYLTYGTILDGPDMVKHFLNRTFDLPTGDLKINEEGERMVDILGDLLGNDGKFKTLMRYDHRKDRIILASDDEINDFWPGRRWPPLNEPICGFTGIRCADEQRRATQLVAGAAAGSLIVIIAIIGVVAAW